MKKQDIESFIPDDMNFNMGTEFGARLLEKSLSELGIGRSILADKDDRIIAGNKTHETAVSLGFKDAIVVETTGDELVAVKRTDMDIHTLKGRQMALADNTISKKNQQWDEDNINKALNEFDIDLNEWKVPVVQLPEEMEDADDAPGTPDASEFKELKIKFEPDAYIWILSKLRSHGDDFGQSLLKLLNLA